MSMPEPFDGYVAKPPRVSSTCLVNVARNKYWVPCERAGQMVSTRLYPGRVDVVPHDAIVASHAMLTCAEWSSVLGDFKMTTALLDLLKHHGHIPETANQFYRFRHNSD